MQQSQNPQNGDETTTPGTPETVQTPGDDEKRTAEQASRQSNTAPAGAMAGAANYVAASTTTARSIRWLVFAIGICAAINLVAVFTRDYGNYRYAIDRLDSNIKTCQDKIDKIVGHFTEGKDANQQAAKKRDIAQSMRLVPCDLTGSTLDTLEKDLAMVRELQTETWNVSVPILGITVVYSDYLLVVCFAGVLLILWLTMTLRFSRSTLTTLFNDWSMPKEDAAITIPAHFVLLWPGGARRRVHWALWAILGSFPASVLFVLWSDTNDLWFRHPGWRHALVSEPGWTEFEPYVIMHIAVLVTALVASFLLILRTRLLVRDVRNLLMLLSWSKDLFPVLYAVLKKTTRPLVDEKNELLYQEMESSNKFQFTMRLRFVEAQNSAGEGASRSDESDSDPNELVIGTQVDFWRSMRTFWKLRRECVAEERERRIRKEKAELEPWELYKFDPDLMVRQGKEDARSIGAESREVRAFFFQFLTDHRIEPRVAEQFFQRGVLERGLPELKRYSYERWLPEAQERYRVCH